MKRNSFTLIAALFFMSLGLSAQIPSGALYPVQFKVSAQDGFHASYPYGTQVVSSTSTWGVDTVKRTFSAPIVWARTATPGDSLLCAAATAGSLTGKVALIRRGTCNFSTKVQNAQNAGAVAVVIVNDAAIGTERGGLINLAADATGASVKIPAIFITMENGNELAAKINSGATVTATFEVLPMSRPYHAYGYQTPIDAAVPLENVGILFINGTNSTIPSVELTATFKNPKGVTQSIKQTATNIPSTGIQQVWWQASYTPTEVGEYTVTYSNSLNAFTIVKKFRITQGTFALDNDTIDGAISPGNEFFVNSGLNYDFGNFYYTGTKALTGTHVTFAIANPKELYTGDKEADKFRIRIYDADPDGNFIVPGGASSYDALNEKPGGAVIVGFQDYFLTGKENPYDLITVPLEGNAKLGINKVYLVMVQYNGLNAALGIAPAYATAGRDPLPGLGACVFLDRLYVGGWAGGFKGVIRLHVTLATDTDEELSSNKLSVSPNPATNFVTMNLGLEAVSKKVNVNVIDFYGRIVQTHQLDNVKSGAFTFDVSTLSTGTYFLSVSTDEGFRSEKFVVVKN